MHSAYYLHGWEDKVDRKDFNMMHVENDDGYLVRDIMTPIIFKVDVSAKLSEMADIMVGGRIHRLLVTENDKLVGIVTTLDMLKAIKVFDTQT
jgi:CBS domain-containing protein